MGGWFCRFVGAFFFFFLGSGGRLESKCENKNHPKKRALLADNQTKRPQTNEHKLTGLRVGKARARGHVQDARQARAHVGVRVTRRARGGGAVLRRGDADHPAQARPGREEAVARVRARYGVVAAAARDRGAKIAGRGDADGPRDGGAGLRRRFRVDGGEGGRNKAVGELAYGLADAAADAVVELGLGGVGGLGDAGGEGESGGADGVAAHGVGGRGALGDLSEALLLLLFF